MGFLDKAKAAAEQAAQKAKETAEDLQTKREISGAFDELGHKTLELIESGAVSHPELMPIVEKIHALKAKLEEETKAAEEQAPVGASS
jgi:hypothetical protein